LASIKYSSKELLRDYMIRGMPISRSERANVAHLSSMSALPQPGSVGLRRWRLLTLLPVALIGMLLLSGCGGSKPAFCSHVSELEKSVQALGSLNLQSGVSGFEADLKKVDSSAKAVVSSAKSEFPTQTTALEKSVRALDGTVKELSSATTTQARIAAIATLASEVSSAGTALSEFSSATKSKCS
jgi:hypothetical protein